MQQSGFSQPCQAISKIWQIVLYSRESLWLCQAIPKFIETKKTKIKQEFIDAMMCAKPTDSEFEDLSARNYNKLCKSTTNVSIQRSSVPIL